MSLEQADIERIADLARLEIEASERDGYARDLNRILEFVEQMDRLDTTGVEPLAHPLDLTARLREDRVTETDQRERFQSIAPAVESGLFLVPRVIE